MRSPSPADEAAGLSAFNGPLPPRRRSWPVLTVFAAIVCAQLLLAIVSIDVLSAVRAYVAGESLYSKGQKDAHGHLLDYATWQRESDYQLFLRAIAAPIGDRRAREAMQSEPPDVEAARAAFLAGGSHPDDVPGLIRLFRWFHETPLMSGAIATWTAGDAAVEEVRALAERAHGRVEAGETTPADLLELRERASLVNARLTRLESRFSDQLGQAARLTERLLFGLNTGLAALLAVTGIAFVRHSGKLQARAEDEVRHRQQSLQRLLDSAAEGLYGLDTAGRCTFINRAALDMLGYEREGELLGTRIHDVLAPRPADADGPPAAASPIVTAHLGPAPVHVSGDRIRRRDGSEFAVDYWSHPMLDHGRHVGAVATFFDITERLAMQEALRRGEWRLAGLVDAVNDGVVAVDGDGRVVLFNRAAERMFGVPAAEAIGSGIERFLPPGRRGPGPRPRHELALDDEAGAVRELTGRRADGSTFPIEASLSGSETEGGPLVTAVLRDITELQNARAERQARQALEAQNRAKTEFLSRMSHELRTPLNAVLGFTQLLRLDPRSPPTLRQLERIQHVETAGNHLLALVNDVLDLSRVESGQMPVALASLDLRGCVADAIAMVVPLAAQHGVAVAMEDEAAESVHVVADPLRLRQVLVNLLSNGIKYNRPGGRVEVAWASRGDRCEIRIADTGAGMSPAKLERLFEPFNRLGAENSPVEGTGIGLMLSRRLSELMGGQLAVESAEGSGTVATVCLACSELEMASDSAFAPPSQHGPLEPGLRVLYAEDNEVNVELVRQVVSLRPAVQLTVALDGAEAIARAREERPDLMLVDMNLGDMTGLELAQALREDPATRAIRLVALSADALPAQIRDALDAGFEAYLTKPIDFRELLQTLDDRMTA